MKPYTPAGTLKAEPQKPYQKVLAAIRQRQLARGHNPPTRGEVDAYLKSERASWD